MKFIDNKQALFALATPGAGKSHFYVGLYLAALNSSGDYPLNPSGDLVYFLDMLEGHEDPWNFSPIEPGDYYEFSFRYRPENSGNIRQLAMLNYGNEYLWGLSRLINGDLKLSDHPEPEKIRQGIEFIKNADSLVFLLDVYRFLDARSGIGIGPYFDLIQGLEGKEMIPIATKCDLLLDDFKDQKDMSSLPESYEEFKDYVHNRLTQSQVIRSLVNECGGEDIHPVLYMTKENERGKPIPIRDETGSPIIFGFKEALDRIIG